MRQFYLWNQSLSSFSGYVLGKWKRVPFCQNIVGKSRVRLLAGLSFFCATHLNRRGNEDWGMFKALRKARMVLMEVEKKGGNRFQRNKRERK